MIWQAIKNRLGETSTWKGLLSMAVGIGLALNGSQMDLIAAAMVANYSALSAIFPDTFGKLK